MRFPSTGDHVEVKNCPLCGSPVDAVTQHQSALVPAHVSQPAGRKVVALLDNIRSLRNVGAIFRTSDAAGISHLYLGGYTATPEHPKLAKTALGAELSVPWTQYRNGLDAVAALQEQGYAIWAVEGGQRAESIFEVSAETQPIALVFGNETAGVDPAILELADKVVAIPMRGIKHSLNVETAFGVIAYTLMDTLAT